MGESISFLEREIPVIYEADCVVVGGGTAGIAVALSALNEGISTIIIEKTIALGGTQTNALVSPMMPTYVQTQSINTEITNRLQKEGVETDDGKTTCSWFNVESLTYTLEQLIREKNGEILYDSTYIDCIKSGETITYIIIQTCDGLRAVKGKTFVDASADAVVAKTAGVHVMSGNEKGENQQISFRFEMGGICVETLRRYMKELGDTFCVTNSDDFYEIAMVQGKGFVLEPIFRQAVENGDLLLEDLRYFQAFTQPGKPSVMSFNCPHIPHIYTTTDPLLRSKAVTKGREMMQRLARFLPKYVPGFERAFLLREATQLGIRESYRIVGQYVLTEDDYVKRATFSDGIARGDWYVDVHSTSNEEATVPHYEKGEYYEIPYRSLVTNEVANFIVAGRHISATFLMQASLRIQPTLRDVGEAVGMACAQSIQMNTPLNKIDGKMLKERLYTRVGEGVTNERG